MKIYLVYQVDGHELFYTVESVAFGFMTEEKANAKAEEMNKHFKANPMYSNWYAEVRAFEVQE